MTNRSAAVACHLSDGRDAELFVDLGGGKPSLHARTPVGASEDLIGLVAEAAFLADRSGQIVAVNASAAALTGFSEPELLSKTLLKALGPGAEGPKGISYLKPKAGEPVCIRFVRWADLLPGYSLFLAKPV